MKQGGGKSKGSQFERDVCVALSKWITNGERIDCLWRSAMSGGRATVSRGKVRQAGDITAVSPEGHALTDIFYIECKAYKDINLDCLVKGKGALLDFWMIASKEALSYQKQPMLIFKRNHWPVIVMLGAQGVAALRLTDFFPGSVFLQAGDMRFVKFDVMLAKEFPYI